MIPNVIGLVGASGAGKTTAAKALGAHGYRVISMSCVLKDMLRALGFSEADLEGDQAYRLTPQVRLGGLSPRQVASSLGTEWARDTVHPDLLVNAVETRIRAVLATGCNVAIDGMRFPNEWEMTHRLGGEVWKIVREGVAPQRRLFDRIAHAFGWHPRIHESEYHWPDAPAAVTLFNEGTPDGLAAWVSCILKKSR